MTTYHISNDFYSVDHPLVSALLASEITIEQFIERVTPEDPFIVRRDDKEDAVILHGFHQASLESAQVAWRRIIDMRTQPTLGLPNLDAALAHRDIIIKAVPETAAIFAAIDKNDAKCKECDKVDQLLKLTTAMRAAVKAGKDVAKLKAVLPPAGYKLLQGASLTPEELATLPARPSFASDAYMHKILGMKAYPVRRRPSFFESDACGRGSSTANCDRCRRDRAFREHVNRKYFIPVTVDVETYGHTATVAVTEDPQRIVDFTCPFAAQIADKYPDTMTLMRNAFGALGRIVGAKLQGKQVKLDSKLAGARMAVCNSCDRRNAVDNRCIECGCFLQLKQQLATEHCPLSRWPGDNPGELTVVNKAAAPAPVEQKEILMLKPDKRKPLMLSNYQAIGDIVIMTAAVRDFVIAHGDKYRVNVSTPFPDLWTAHEYLDTSVTDETPGVQHVKVGYDWCVNHSNQSPYNFIHGFHIDIAQKLGIPWFPVTEFGGHVPLTQEETSWISMIHEHYTHKDTPYWLIVNGGKPDYTAKHWLSEYAQQVVNSYRNKIQFVQIGTRDYSHMHDDLKGVINLVGKTDIRQLVRLIYHAQGIVTPITGAMHLSAAIPTRDDHPPKRACVTICGGREPHQFIDYANHQTLHTNGVLPCCDNGGCWKSRTVPLGVGGADEDRLDRELCIDTVPWPENNKRGRPVQRCMTLITPSMVTRAIDNYMQHPRRKYLTDYGMKTIEA